MKITHINDAMQVDRSANRTAGTDKSSAKAPTTSPGGEKLSISDFSHRLSDLEAKLSQGEEFDATRVDAIKQAIREGKFTVNAEAVADKLIQSVKEFLHK